MKIKFFRLSFIFGLFIALSAFMVADSNEGDSMLVRKMMQGLQFYHYETQEIDDNFSEEIYKSYIKKLDGGKRFFTQKDIDELEKHKMLLDNEIKNGTYAFFNASNKIIENRIDETEQMYKKILSESFDFKKEESISLKGQSYVSGNQELYERWRLELKNQVLLKLVSYLERQETAIEDKDTSYTVQTFEELETKAREKILDSYNKWFKRLNKIEHKDRLSQYLNSITETYDPHTGYFPPKEKKNFDEKMSGRFEGIGAQLQQNDGYLKITNVIVGGAAFRQGDLKKGDLIMKVAQGKKGEPVDIYEMRMDDAIDMIKGKKGTEVCLTVKDVSGKVKQICIERDVVELKETFAKSAVLETDDKYGYIYLPKFYSNFNSEDGRTCYGDVKKEIQKLQQENVSGIILDLRNNGGGSLDDVVKMSGLFIPQGPIVQVKSRGKSPFVYRDKNSKVEYDGALIIMVNGYSASASEILAAAMQDYKRAIIVGSNSTYGKGTVQRFFNMPNDFGSVKLTVQKFYRIDGGATQLKGVEPDITLPDNFSYIKTGEKQNSNAMAWDEINPASYQVWDNKFDKKINKLKAKSEARVATNPTFALIDENAKRIKENRERKFSTLNLKNFRTEKAKEKEENKKFKAISKEIEGLNVLSLQADLETLSKDENLAEERDRWFKALRKDVHLYETLKILGDLGK